MAVHVLVRSSFFTLDITALKMTLKRAKRMEVDKLMIFANLPFVQRNWDNLAKWVKKDWCHGGLRGKGKGKPIANSELWKEIYTHLEKVEIAWMWNPSGKTFQSVAEKATSMALLHEER